MPDPFERRKLIDELAMFFDRDPLTLSIVARGFSPVDLPNLHRAIEEYGQDHEAERRVIGYTGAVRGMQERLGDLISRGPRPGDVEVGPVQYRSVPIDFDREMACVESGIHLIRSGSRRIAAHLRRDNQFGRGALELEVMAPESLATAFIDELRERLHRSNVYRGKIISLGTPQDPRQVMTGFAGIHVSFHRLPPVTREQIILPEETLALIERNTLGFLRHADLLRRSGRSVKRGLLLHGKPGTGKTFTAKWLAQTLPEATVILLSGEQLGLIKECCQLARLLAPSLVIMEDVDLIAGERDERRHPFFQVTLHQLLNEMDGLASDAEVIFLLTTNRPDVLEPALAARPGRVDQAIEFPLPDAGCRRLLLDLYGQGLVLALNDPDHLIARMEGASPAFIQELVRKAAVVAAEENSLEGETLKLTDTHFDSALRDLLLGGGNLTRNLLGFTAENRGAVA